MQRADFCLGVRLIIVREEEGFVVNCTRSLELRNEPRSIPALKTCGLTNLNLEYSRIKYKVIIARLLQHFARSDPRSIRLKTVILFQLETNLL